MANNPYVNKVIKADGTTIIDISDTTAAAADVAVGKYFYTAAGAKVEGTNSGSSLPDGDNMGYGGAPPIVGQAIVGTTKL